MAEETDFDVEFRVYLNTNRGVVFVVEIEDNQDWHYKLPEWKYLAGPFETFVEARLEANKFEQGVQRPGTVINKLR